MTADVPDPLPPKKPKQARLGSMRGSKRGSKPRERRPVIPSELDTNDHLARVRLADYLKLMSWWLGRPPVKPLPLRLNQTLKGLLRGQSEKQIARDLDVSIHTVHEYVKELHRRLGVSSRGELLSRFFPNGAP